jgi:hypothetical protein
MSAFVCPQCGGDKTGHTLLEVFGIRTLLCPNLPMGEIKSLERSNDES